MKRSINTFSARLLLAAVGLAVAFLTPQLALAQGPTIYSINPSRGLPSGGGTVTISGAYFGSGIFGTLTIGGSSATVSSWSNNTIVAVVPAGLAGPASVEVTTGAGTSSPNTLYTYNLPLQLLDTTTSVGPTTAPYTSPLPVSPGDSITVSNIMAGVNQCIFTTLSDGSGNALSGVGAVLVPTTVTTGSCNVVVSSSSLTFTVPNLPSGLYKINSISLSTTLNMVLPGPFIRIGSAVSPGGGTPAPPLQISTLGSMSISVVPNQSLLGTGAATVVANQSGTWTATTATPWLFLTQSLGAFPGVVAGTANAAGLAAGTYTGSISVAGTSPGGAQTITIPVTLTVNSPAVLTANPTAITMASSYPAGSATGYTLQTGAPGLAFTVSTSPSSTGWLTVSPASGIAPTPITVTLDPSKAIPGTYTDSIVVSSAGVASVTVPVKMAVSGLFTTLPQQVNSGTAAGPDHTVAPNEIVSLYLTNFSCATAPVVSINGTPVSWSSYAPGQINYAVPANITSPAALTVACNGTTAWTFNGLTTAAVVPGIFTMTGTGKGQAAVVNSDGTINGGTNPATRGSWLSVYGTGFGVFNEAGTNGLRTVAGAVTATIGGVDATVLYAGNTPGATDGLQQFNLQIPAGVTAGTAVPIVLTVNGTPTQTTATVSLK